MAISLKLMAIKIDLIHIELMNKYIVVNYHYIRDQSDDGIKACGIEEFKKHIDYFNKNYQVVTAEELYDAAVSGKEGKFCLLTFNDGLGEHYKVVMALLKKNKISGIFFPVGMTLRENKIPLTHKTQLILSKTGVPKLVEMFHEFFGDKYKIGDRIRVEPRRQFDDILTSNLKETLMKLPLEERKSFINDTFVKLYENEAKISQELFISKEQLREMVNQRMEIGTHTYSHLSLETLTYENQKKDIILGKEEIENVIGKECKIFSYPHLRYNDNTLKILEELGIILSFAGGRRVVEKNDHRFTIPRYDANDFDALIKEDS